MQSLNDIRSAFLNYFGANAHAVVPSAPLGLPLGLPPPGDSPPAISWFARPSFPRSAELAP